MKGQGKGKWLTRSAGLLPDFKNNTILTFIFI